MLTLAAASLALVPASALATGTTTTQTTTSTTTTPAPAAAPAVPTATTPASPTAAPAATPASTRSTSTSTTSVTADTAAKTTGLSARKVTAHIASTLSDNIIDYAFSPATLHIKVGDTVTWTNSGKQPHTATASNKSFDTGILTTGKSASHTFNTAGTISYICTVHPYMHGTIVVAAKSSSSSSSNSGTTTTAASNSGGSTTTTASSGGGSSLPVTGMDLLGTMAIGALMLGAGVAIRRKASGR